VATCLLRVTAATVFGVDAEDWRVDTMGRKERRDSKGARVDSGIDRTFSAGRWGVGVHRSDLARLVAETG